MRQALSGIISRSANLSKAVMMLAAAVTFIAAQTASSMATPHSAIIIDANTGKTLYASDANGRRYPASLTKMMTLYLTFEALSSGKISRSSKVTFSANAAAEPPTKLGVKKGGQVTVDAAILSMVTKSANDSATAMGEFLGGNEANFARMMTAKARALGMRSTVFRNANGLPNPGQFTTAHDMAILGIALREHFPQYYGYFSQRSFMFGRQRINGHNRVLDRVKGADGIKTGYTAASGFNLVTSVKDGGRNIVGVVMGGSSGGSRDSEMVAMLKTYMPKASSRGGSGDLIAKADDDDTPVVALAKAILPKHNAPTPDIRPAREELASAPDNVEPLQEDIPFKTADESAPAAKTPAPIIAKAARPITASVVAAAYAEPEENVDPVNTASLPSGWAVQVASSPSKGEAQAILEKTSKQASRILADASGFTAPFKKDGVTYFRARYSGFGSKDAAWKACNGLKKHKIQCYAVQQ
ncbi:MAG TPA: D-alanyl-D-alanine carboxypeptidase [Mesorhizobium sp.]